MQCERYNNLNAMCTLSVKMDDRVVNRMRTLFDGDKAMNMWIETVLHKAMVEYADEVESRNMKGIKSKKFLERLEVLKNDPEGFFKMGGIFGKVSDDFSWDELREEAMFEKYGV